LIPKRSVGFSPDGAYLAAGDFEGGKFTLWNRNGTLVRTVSACPTVVVGIVFSPDSQTIATGCNTPQIKLWNLVGQLRKVIEGHQSIIRSVAFSSDGTQIVSGSVDTTAKLWQLDGTLLTTFAQHTAPVLGVAYTNHARYGNGSGSSGSGSILIASASSDRTIGLWQPDGTTVATINGHSGAVNKVAFSADGRKVISASADSTAIIWDLNTIIHSDNVLKLGCEWIKGYLHNNSNVAEGDRTLCASVIDTP
jgi:WD40 repeat protein